MARIYRLLEKLYAHSFSKVTSQIGMVVALHPDYSVYRQDALQAVPYIFDREALNVVAEFTTAEKGYKHSENSIILARVPHPVTWVEFRNDEFTEAQYEVMLANGGTEEKPYDGGHDVAGILYTTFGEGQDRVILAEYFSCEDSHPEPFQANLAVFLLPGGRPPIIKSHEVTQTSLIDERLAKLKFTGGESITTESLAWGLPQNPEFLRNKTKMLFNRGVNQSFVNGLKDGMTFGNLREQQLAIIDRSVSSMHGVARIAAAFLMAITCGKPTYVESDPPKPVNTPDGWKRLGNTKRRVVMNLTPQRAVRRAKALVAAWKQREHERRGHYTTKDYQPNEHWLAFTDHEKGGVTRYRRWIDTYTAGDASLGTVVHTGYEATAGDGHPVRTVQGPAKRPGLNRPLTQLTDNGLRSQPPGGGANSEGEKET